MGLSAKDSRVFYVPIDCPVLLGGATPAAGSTPLAFSEQVTRIEITPSVYQRKYGHDKSFGANDVCSGVKSWDGSLTTKVAEGAHPFTFTAGDTVWLRIWPIGVDCGGAIQGYAVIDSDPVVMNLENGEPVEHNYRYSSKGRWKGILGSGTPGRWECECGSESSVGSGSFMATPAAEDTVAVPVHAPQTAYQWTGSVWLPVYNECREGFAIGPVPDASTQPGTYVGALLFVPCVAA
jgi:hypothetical protein